MLRRSDSKRARVAWRPVAQAVAPSFLLQVPPGWSLVGKQVIRQIDPANPPTIQLEGYEWFDVSGLGLGGTQNGIAGAVQRFRTQVQSLGSDLYATAVIKKTEFNFNVLGVQLGRVDRYRLILCHSQAQVFGWFLVILGIALSTVILYQYLTTGQSPLLSQLASFWSTLVKSAVAPIGPAISGTLIPVFLIGGGLLLAYAVAAKELGVAAQPTRPPHARVGVKTGPLTTETGT